MKPIKFSTCDFCEHDVGPYKTKTIHCALCFRFNQFELKKNMPPIMDMAYKQRSGIISR